MSREGQIKFSLNKVPFTVIIQSVNIYPQAYATSLTAYDKLNNVVDIGGHTTDCLQLEGLRANMDICTSLYFGV